MWSSKLAVVAGLLCLVIATNAFALPFSFPSSKIDATRVTRLMKRSPLPQPSGRARERLSINCRNRPESYYETPNESDQRLDEVINPIDFLSLIDKAVYHARESSSNTFDDLSTNESCMKWLTRAQASILHDANLIQEIQNRYAIKMRDRRVPQCLRQRAKEKLQYWTSLLNSPRRPILEEAMDRIATTYEEDVEFFEEMLQEQQQANASQVEKDLTYGFLMHARNALHFWNSTALSSAIAFQMMGKELQFYLQESNHSEDPLNRASVQEHALHAIAWLRRARQLQSQGM